MSETVTTSAPRTARALTVIVPLAMIGGCLALFLLWHRSQARGDAQRALTQLMDAPPDRLSESIRIVTDSAADEALIRASGDRLSRGDPAWTKLMLVRQTIRPEEVASLVSGLTHIPVTPAAVQGLARHDGVIEALTERTADKRSDLASRKRAALWLSALSNDRQWTAKLLDFDQPLFLAMLEMNRQLDRSLLKSVSADGQVPDENHSTASVFPDVSEPTRQAVDRAMGRVAENFAFCLDLPRTDFASLDRSLRGSGYRLARVRPFWHDNEISLAVMWNRDGLASQVRFDLSVDQVEDVARQARQSGGMTPIDMAMYANPDDKGIGQRRYSVVFAALDEQPPTKFNFSLDRLDTRSNFLPFTIDDWGPVAIASVPQNESDNLNGILWHRRGTPGWKAQMGKHREVILSRLAEGSLQLGDVSIVRPVLDVPPQTYYENQVENFAKKLAAAPDDYSSHTNLAHHLSQLRRYEEALVHRDWAANRSPSALAFGERAVVHAALGNEQAARDDLKRSGEKSARTLTMFQAQVEMMLGNEQRAAELIEASLSGQTLGNYNAACLLARLAGKVSDPTSGQKHRDRAVELLQEEFKRDVELIRILAIDTDLLELHQHSGFIELVEKYVGRVLYSFISWPDDTVESKFLPAVPVANQLDQMEELINQGFTINSLSSLQVDQEVLSASSWAKPKLSGDALDRSLRRQVRAALLSKRLGDPDPQQMLVARPTADPIHGWIVRVGKSIGDDGDRTPKRREQTDHDPSWVVDAAGHALIACESERLRRDGKRALRGEGKDGTGQETPRPFLLSRHEVTREQYRKFLDSRVTNESNEKMRDDADSRLPQTGVSWFDAARYCIWLNEVESVPKRQWPYLPTSEGDGIRLPTDYLMRTGYRLPTQEEWQFAAGAGWNVPLSFWSTSRLLEDQAWTMDNSEGRLHTVGTRLPNVLGFHDLFGNAAEWTTPTTPDYRNHETIDGSPLGKTVLIEIDREKMVTVVGGSVRCHPSDVVNTDSINLRPANWSEIVGFRVARTVSAEHLRSEADGVITTSGIRD